MIASYCTDALAEPQELRWVLRKTDDAINVTIYKFPDVAVSPDLPDSDGTVQVPR